MTPEKYPHAPECLYSSKTKACVCGATQRNADYEAGRADTDARAVAVVEACIQLDQETTVCALCSHIDQEDLSHPHTADCPLVVNRWIDRDGRRL